MPAYNMVEQITAIPEARIIISRVLALLKKEDQVSEAFYKKVSENEKAEFING